MPFPAQFNLSDLDGSNGFVLNGIDPVDLSGDSVSSAGDVNGDGIDDLIIGARGADRNDNSFVGESYVVFGGSGIGSSGTIELSTLNGTNGFVLNGIDPGDNSGDSVSSAGDVNNDGVDDLIIDAPGADPDGTNGAGESYVVFGGTDIGSSGTIELSTLDGTNGFVLKGIDPDDTSGVSSVSGLGDVNADGVDDLIIGAPGGNPNGTNGAGESYVVFGGTDIGSSGIIELSNLDGTNGFVLNGIDPGDFSGASVSSLGDVNGDGVDDLIINAPFADPNGTNDAGENYVVFGGSDIGSSGTFELSNLDGTNGFVLNGIDEFDRTGSVSSAGDVNDDGVDDLIIGASGADPNGNNDAGENYVVFGGSDIGSSGTIELSSLDGTNGFVINGIDSGDGSGTSRNAGDVNGDGVDDLIIGARGFDPNGIDRAGESYVVFGTSDIGSGGIIELSNLDGTNGFVLNGIDVLDRSGFSVSNAADVNGDEVDDLIIGAPGADPNGNNDAGESYVVFGIRDNTAPSAVDDTFNILEDKALSGSVFADNGNGADSDPDGDAFTVTEVNGTATGVNNQITLASGALLTLNSDGNFHYDPNGQFDALNHGETASDSFTYTIDDGNGGTDMATVNVTVNGATDIIPLPKFWKKLPLWSEEVLRDFSMMLKYEIDFNIFGSTDYFTAEGSGIATDILFEIEFPKFDDDLFAVDRSLFTELTQLSHN